MKNIDLNQIGIGHIEGKWEVQNRSSAHGEKNIFSDINLLDIKKNMYRSVNGKVVEGEWEVLREKEIIYNPQIKFYVGKKEVGNAIITRLFTEDLPDATIYKLTLYFTTGLELILKKFELLIL